MALANRAFLRRAVAHLTRLGIDQFLDLGSGIPTEPNVHQIVQAVHPEARVIYVDNDPTVMAHNRALRAHRPGVETIMQDLRQPQAVLADSVVRGLLDFRRPIAVLLVTVLHLVRRDLTPNIVARYLRALPPGSHLVISTACSEGTPPETVESLERAFSVSATPMAWRTRTEIEELFTDLELLPPGLVDITRWEPRGAATTRLPGTVKMLGGIGRTV